jgi:hypothetical protein
MKGHDLAFQCDPCRQIIIFFELSDPSPQMSRGGAVRGDPDKE